MVSIAGDTNMCVCVYVCMEYMSLNMLLCLRPSVYFGRG